MEKWSTRDTLDRHLNSAVFTRVLQAMEYSNETPTMNFYEVDDLGGLELVENIRMLKLAQKPKGAQ